MSHNSNAHAFVPGEFLYQFHMYFPVFATLPTAIYFVLICEKGKVEKRGGG